MDQKAARTAVAKAFRAHKIALRKGHWRLAGTEVQWYVDLRSAGPRPDAALHFEVGGWLPALDQPEPEGGAVDCPLLVDVPLDTAGGAGDVAAAVDALVALLSGVGTLAELRAALEGPAFTDAIVDRDLRTLLGR
ncbi:hypothetical protein AB3X52_08980 [Nocardioides sp. DS6]|uniref:Uncharacterized protein n=1 Tax=Nocardioides eburneus TaxID=3231482 RepID=A0ABV3T0E2_9ACTN